MILAAADADGTIRLWETRTEKPPLTIQGYRSAVTRLAWSPDGATLASAADNEVRLWDIGGRQVRTLNHEGTVLGIAWTSDGQTLLSVDYTEIHLWQRNGGPERRALKANTTGTTVFVWSWDSKTLASANVDGMLRLWDAASGKPFRTMQAGKDSVSVLDWSRDGRMLASAGLNGTIQLWEAASGQPLRTLQAHERPVSDIAWSPDGKTLASSGYDGTLRLLPGTPAALLDQVRDRIRLFTLSPAECHQYFGSDDCPPLR
jgi:WD40 repeat protein